MTNAIYNSDESSIKFSNFTKNRLLSQFDIGGTIARFFALKLHIRSQLKTLQIIIHLIQFIAFLPDIVGVISSQCMYHQYVWHCCLYGNGIQ